MRKEFWLLILSGIFYGTITPGGHFLLDRGLSLYEVSFYRSLIVCLILLPAVLIRPGYMMRREKIPFYIVYGLVGGVLELLMFAGIALGVPVAIVVLLLYTQPIWTVMIGRLTLGERITRMKLVSVLLGVLGLVFLLRSWETGAGGSFIGILCALAGGVLLSFWVVLGKRSTMQDQHYVTITFGWSLFAFIWLIILLPLIKFLVTDQSMAELSLDIAPTVWIYMVLFAFLGGVIPHLLFFKGLNRVSASVAGIILLLEPVSATILAWLFFSQSVGIYIFLGGVLILLSNYIVIKEASSDNSLF